MGIQRRVTGLERRIRKLKGDISRDRLRREEKLAEQAAARGEEVCLDCGQSGRPETDADWLPGTEADEQLILDLVAQHSERCACGRPKFDHAVEAMDQSSRDQLGAALDRIETALLVELGQAEIPEKIRA